MLREMKCFVCGAVGQRVSETCAACQWHKCPACDACLCKLSPEEQRVARAVFNTSMGTIELLAGALEYMANEAREDDPAREFMGIARFALHETGQG